MTTQNPFEKFEIDEDLFVDMKHYEQLELYQSLLEFAKSYATESYNEGFDKGHDDGYKEGHTDGYAEGHSGGYDCAEMELDGF